MIEARRARMEKAVMAPPDDTDRLQVFERGEAIEVPVGRIEAELAALWRRAAEARPGQIPNAVTRACLWNLVVRVRGEADFKRAKQRDRRPVAAHPGAHHRDAHRARRAGEPARVGRGQLAAARRRRAGVGLGRGDAVGRRARRSSALPSLVRSLLYLRRADGDVLGGGAAVDGAGGARAGAPGRSADRRHAQARRREAASRELCAHRRRAIPSCELADLSWIGISPLRGMCAALFDPPRDPSVLERLDRVRVVSNIQGTQARGAARARLADVAPRLERAGAAAGSGDGARAGRRRAATASR